MSTSNLGRYVTASILSVSLLLLPHLARADHSDPFIQVTCSRALDYFFIRTFKLDNTSVNGTSDSAQIKDYGVYDLGDFVKSNYSCALPTRSILIKVKQYTPVTQGKCYENDAVFEIQINQKSAYTFDAFGENCANLDHQVEITAPFDNTTTIKDCVHPEGIQFNGDPRPIDPKCTKTNFLDSDHK